MIQDMALRWVVTLLFVFSAGVCVQAIVANRHSGLNVIGNSLHAIMAVAMAVMAWPRGAELPTRAPMIFFVVAALWFAVITVRSAGHRVANGYHALMMLAMSWMYAAMGGLKLRSAESDSMAGMPGMGMSEMPGMPGMPDMQTSSGHAGHAGHSGAGAHGGSDSLDWVGTLNWVCTIGFGVATAFWLYRLITARLQPSESDQTLGILCQLAMAAGMAIMFGVML
jgi:hypothetical protein